MLAPILQTNVPLARRDPLAGDGAGRLFRQAIATSPGPIQDSCSGVAVELNATTLSRSRDPRTLMVMAHRGHHLEAELRTGDDPLTLLSMAGRFEILAFGGETAEEQPSEDDRHAIADPPAVGVEQTAVSVLAFLGSDEGGKTDGRSARTSRFWLGSWPSPRGSRH